MTRQTHSDVISERLVLKRGKGSSSAWFVYKLGFFADRALKEKREVVLQSFYIMPMPPISGAAAGAFSGISTTKAPIVIAVPAMETAF